MPGSGRGGELAPVAASRDGVVLRLVDRQTEAELGPAVRPRGGPDRAAQRLHDALADEQPDAGAGGRDRRPGCAVVQVEQPVAGLDVEARPVVEDADRRAVGVASAMIWTDAPGPAYFTALLSRLRMTCPT